MAAHSSILAWRIPWTKEPGGLHSVGHDGSGLAHTHAVRQSSDFFPSQLMNCKPSLSKYIPDYISHEKTFLGENAARHAGSYPKQGSNLCPLQWKHRVLTPGPPGKAYKRTFQWKFWASYNSLYFDH